MNTPRSAGKVLSLAVLAAAVLCPPEPSRADDTRGQMPPPRGALQADETAGESARQGAAQEEAAAAMSDDARKGIRLLLDNTIKAILRNDYEDMIDSFVEADRERLDPSRDAFAPVKPAVEQLRATFKNRYNQDFSEDLENAAIDYLITPGAEQRTASVLIAPTNPAGQPSEAPQASLRLVDRGIVQQRWHIDLPNTVDAQALASALKFAVSELNSNQEVLPADANSARRVIAQRLIAALSGENISR